MIETPLTTRIKPLLWRGLICWALGTLLLWTDEVNNFDLRFKIRGPRPISEQVGVVTVSPAEIAEWGSSGRHQIPQWKETWDLTDSYYWDPLLWKNILVRILDQNPRAVAVTFYFPSGLSRAGLSAQDLKVFSDPRIIWASPSSETERVTVPLFANSTMSNVGSYHLTRDQDGIIRRFTPGSVAFPHLTERVLGSILQEREPRLINYQGEVPPWNKYSLTDLLSPEFPDDALRGKVVVLGSSTSSEVAYLTPFGASNRAEVMAQILDNLVEDRWVLRLPNWIYSVFLLFVVMLSVLALVQYPQTVGGAITIWILTLGSALSVWFFDSNNIWFPIFSMAVQIATTWVIFIGFQANSFERKNFELEQEQKSLHQLEILKSNFVSLISHDLKTPLAKIQAVVDRLRVQHKDPELIQDLQLLRSYSDELYRYIQSIVKLMQVESRDFRLSIEVGDLNEVIASTLENVSPLAQARRISIDLQLEPLFSYEGDFNLLREVFLNLIENAIKYSPEGSRITVRSFEQNDSVFIEVQDQGPGIPPEEVPKLFQRFVRGKSQEMETKGTGLGLYLVKYFVELHGGRVQLESKIGKGTTVRLQLPLDFASREGGTYAESHLSADRG